jgi:hypothetical protein
MRPKLIITSLLATALLAPGQASAECTINSARLQQVSEREILAIIDGYCTKENGESGYYTEIAPDTYGEVMAVYGNRNIDQHGHGFESRYGFNIVFSDSAETYRAGVWIADEDGVVRSAEMSIANSFYATTTTTTTTVPQTTTTVSQPVAKPAPVVHLEPVAEVAETAPVTTTTVPETTTTTTTIVVSIQKQVTPKKAAPKCLSRQKSCKLRAVGATKTTGRK